MILSDAELAYMDRRDADTASNYRDAADHITSGYYPAQP
jgi:hypothetical protein